MGAPGGNCPRVPEERGSLPPIQVFGEASAGVSRRGRAALRGGPAPQLPPMLAAGAEAAPREPGAASPALGQRAPRLSLPSEGEESPAAWQPGEARGGESRAAPARVNAATSGRGQGRRGLCVPPGSRMMLAG